MEDKSDGSKIPSNPNPVTKANWVSKIFFWWVNPLFTIGHKRRLEEDDMYDVLREDTSEHLNSLVQREWDKELEKQKSGQKPMLRNALIRTFGKEYLCMGVIAFLEEMIKVVQPLLMGGLIRYFSPNTKVSLLEAYMYAIGVGLCAVIIAIAHHPYFFKVLNIGMQIRVASCSLMYNKSLRLSNKAFGETTTGQIVNLMSNDVARFDQSVIFLHYLVIGPIQGILVLGILWYELGPASLAGFAILLLLIPVQGFMGRLFSKIRQKTAVETDKRVGLMNEILSGMRVIKMYCWEHMFGQAIDDVRSEEAKRVLTCGYARASTFAPFFSSAKLIAFLTFMVYVLQGHRLQAEVVFVAVALFNPVRLTLTLFVPFAVQMTSESLVTISRIQKFLLLEELADTSSVICPAERPKPSDCKVTALNVTAKWDKNLTTNTLENISFEVRAGELLAVIGPVGAGKSSLLMGLLSELPLSSGSIKLNGRVAYASQLPWVFSSSIRHNVVFGQPFDNTRYQRAVKAAALTKDLEILPEGDLTLVGERGVSLSGGQKARISLARAIYFDADIYLLDDPLSAVDAAVGRHIFDKCICGVLRSKPRILVTHQLQYLQAADKILILKDGCPMGLGTYEELAENGVDFAALLKREEDEEEDALSCNLSGVMSDPCIDSSIRHRTVSEGPLLHSENGQLDPYSLTFSKSLDREYLSVLAETPEVTRALLSRSVDIKSYLDTSTDSPRARSVRKRHGKSPWKRAPVTIAPTDNGALIKSADNLPQTIGSMISLQSLDPDIKADYVPPKQEEEERAAGSVTSKVYINYFYRGAGIIGIILFLLLNILAQGTYILADWWLSYWANLEESQHEALKEHNLLLEAGYNQTNITIVDIPSRTYLYIYTGITVSVFVFGLLRAVHVFHILVTAAKHMHNMMFNSIIRCPVLFFDTNPIGRILNRFSKDLGAVDETLPLTMYDFIQCGLMIVGIILVAGIVNPWVFIPTVPLAVLFIYIRRYYLSTSRDIKRLEATTRSPVFSLVSSSLQGLHTLRAYNVQSSFVDQFNHHQNQHTKAWYLFLATSRWFAVRLDWLCALFITAVALCSILARSMMNGGLVGLSLTYSIGLMGLFQWGVRQSAEVENQMTSVERIMEYASLPPEAALESKKDKKPPNDWPRYGVITMENASFRYTDDGVDVLQQLQFCIRAKEKVGIVGRTGAGKSSLIAMLFRLAEPRGLIMIDGVNILDIGLHDLRQKISIIPQDPVLFTGTIRRNLDPFDQHEDVALWNSLEEVQLKSSIEQLPECLDFKISEGGVNFSVGQRQLVCLARAILKRNRILVIDEATANVDVRTDSLIQQTIREKFKECTVLTIAHRLNTIMDSDRVMVMEEGRLKEFDEPFVLLQNETSIFYNMVQQVGGAEFNQLLDIARDSYFRQDSTYDDNIKLQVSEPTTDSIDPPDKHMLPSSQCDMKNSRENVIGEDSDKSMALTSDSEHSQSKNDNTTADDDSQSNVKDDEDKPLLLPGKSAEEPSEQIPLNIDV